MTGSAGESAKRFAPPSRPSDLATVAEPDVLAARPAVERLARRTPVLSSRTISERAGGAVALKAENLQRTGSFKVRGVAAKLDALGETGCAAGVVAASAGNHAQAVAAAATARGVPAEVFVPDDAPMAKVEAARGMGATVHIGGDSVDACVVLALEHAQAEGMAFIHPFDDPAIVAGQGTLGLELVEDVPDLAKVVVPVGGGGLCAGVAVAVKAARPDVELIGVQVAACAPYPESLRRGAPIEAASALTIADGIAVKRPGGLPLALLQRLADDVVVVEEDATAEAMVVLMERCKLVVEGAGAVGVAALLGGQVRAAAHGTTVAVLSGGNVDAGLLASVARRHESQAGRRLVLLTRVPDRPGNLATLLECVADTGANIVDVAHVREGLNLHVRETAIELVLETRGREHADAVMAHLREAGYAAQVVR
jgi:threonine dehydratase